MRSPNVGETSGKANARDVQNMQGAVNEVPSTDPALNVTVGPAPQVDLTGDADPQQMDDQSDKLHDRSTEILKVGQDDAAKPMGEDRIYPDVPKETLRATVPGGAPASGGAQPKIAGADQPGVAEVAQQERGAQVHAAVGQGQGQMTTAQTKQKQGEAEARKKNQADIDKSTADNARRQTGERGSAGEAVRRERVQWRSEQDKKISDADSDAGKQHTDKGRQVLAKRDDTTKQVKSRQDKDNKSIQDNRKQAEDKARKEKARKKEESSGWWGWVKSKAQQAFNALISAVTAIFDFFRKAINGIIGAFKKFADWAIDQARKLAVGLIKALADALIGICDVLLAAFPGLRDKFRKAIEKWRDKAIAKVNQLADELKAAVNKFLDLLADGLNALLNLYEKALKAAVKYVHDKVEAAIEFAQKAIALYGQFKALIGDIAEDPGGWLKKLGNQAMDGIQHHLWGAIKSAVKEWFDQKVESVVGLTSTLVNILVKGCISLKQIGRMAWQAVVAALPMMIIQIVIEKVVSMIVPAAGAILTVIQGLMAAWGTISKIITAFGKFFAFLKAVKSGPGRVPVRAGGGGGRRRAAGVHHQLPALEAQVGGQGGRHEAQGDRPTDHEGARQGGQGREEVGRHRGQPGEGGPEERDGRATGAGAARTGTGGPPPRRAGTGAAPRRGAQPPEARGPRARAEAPADARAGAQEAPGAGAQVRAQAEPAAPAPAPRCPERRTPRRAP